MDRHQPDGGAGPGSSAPRPRPGLIAALLAGLDEYQERLAGDREILTSRYGLADQSWRNGSTIGHIMPEERSIPDYQNPTGIRTFSVSDSGLMVTHPAYYDMCDYTGEHWADTCGMMREARIPMSVIQPVDAERDAAFTFLRACGLDPTEDAVDQLQLSFLPALTVICRRGYDPRGATWRKGGWRGLLHEVRKKTERLMHRSWLSGRFDPDSALDLMNYAGFYYRLRNSGMPWGDLGEPGSVASVDDVSMGDYSDLTEMPGGIIDRSGE